MEPYPQPMPPVDGFAASRARLERIITRLSEADMVTRPESDVEDFLTESGRELQRQLLQDRADVRAAAEARVPGVTGSDGVTRRWAEPGHTRLLITIFGEVEVSRIAYRASGVSNLHPADAAWALPRGHYSHPMRRLIARETATGSTREAQDAVLRFTGQRVGTRQLMGVSMGAAQDVRAFYQGSDSSTGTGTGVGDTLVLSIDATGVNVIDSDLRESTRAARPAGPQPSSAQLARRGRAGRTRMAQVTAIYDAAPAPRTAADVLPRDAAERANRRPGPRAVNRRDPATTAR